MTKTLTVLSVPHPAALAAASRDDADQLGILNHRKTADLVYCKQMSRFLDRGGRIDRKRMGAHDRIDPCMSQLPDVLARVAVGQNTD